MAIYFWRGPFSVVRDGRLKWKIVNAYGSTERIGFNYRPAADAVCAEMNAHPKVYAQEVAKETKEKEGAFKES